MNRRDFSRRTLAIGLASAAAPANAQDPNFYQEAAKRLPVRRFDVVVAGGGTAGVVAALAAARNGASTVLLENKGYTGGVAVEGGTALHSFFNLWKAFPGVQKRQVVKGIPQEIVDRLMRVGGCTGHAEMLSQYDYDSVCTAIDTELYKLVTMDMLQRAVNKWLPRGLEMFGDERGGGTNVRFGLKPMKNAEAQRLYREEVGRLLHDLNMRYVRARLPHLLRPDAEALLAGVLADREAREGIRWEDLLQAPHPDYFRRRGVPAFTMAGTEGQGFADYAEYMRHLEATLPASYLAGRDFREYAEALAQVARGELSVKDASSRMPALRRVGGACPCSKSVRWVVDEPRVAAPAPALQPVA